MILPFPARFVCAALLSFGLLGSAVPATADDAVPTPSTPTAPVTSEPAAPGQTPDATPARPSDEPAAVPEAPRTDPAPRDAAPALPLSEPTDAPDGTTSFVPDLSWNPLADPSSNARYGEHFAQPATPLKAPSPLRTDGSGGDAAIAPRTGTFDVTLVTVQLAGKTVADTDAINMAAARNSITSANAYWNSASAGRLSIRKTNEYRHTSAARITDSYETIMATVTRELNWQFHSYESLVIFVPHADLNYNGSWGILGGGFTDSATSGRVVMPYPSALTNNVVTHEFGHVLGLHHANSLACPGGQQDAPRVGTTWGDSGCWSSEYSDMTDLMGFAQVSSPVINAFMWEYGGFGRGTEIQDIGVPSGRTQYQLKPWSGSDPQRALKFTDPVSREVYYLEFRAPVGLDSATAVGWNQGVKITKQDILGWAGNASAVLTPNSRVSGYASRALTWKAGQTFTTHAGTRVDIESMTAGGPPEAARALVTITPAGGSTSVARSGIDRAAAASPGLGSATSQVMCGLRDGGCFQAFQNGEVLWSPASGAVATRGGAIRDAYRASGAENGPLGYPVSGEMCGLRNNGCYQAFQNGEILWSPASGAVVTRGGAIRDAYRASGAENGPLGYPVSGEMCGLRNGGCYQSFQNGEILWSPASGAVVTRGGAIRDAYRASGAENGPLGYPVSGEMCGLRNGGCYQSFQNGEILWSPASGAVATRGGAIRDAYRASGAENGPLGYPVSGEMCGLTANGCYQSFQNGEILWSPASGAVVTRGGAIRDAYRASGAENGPLGYPTGNETCGTRDKGCYQTFQRGKLTWTPTAGVKKT